MSGEYDFILRVATENLSTYHDFLMNKLFKIMSVGSVQSTFVMKEAKSETAYVLKKPEPKVKKAAQ
jgi:DNA-binding Lrp family transcriptional regulator